MREQLLVVEDDDLVARSIARVLYATATVHRAHSRDEGVAAALGQRWMGAIIDLRLGDDSGLDVLAALRATDRVVPAMVLTAFSSPPVINRTLALRASFACKPLESRLLKEFARDARARSQDGASRVLAVIDSWQERYALTLSEVDILRLAADGARREEIISARGVSGNTHRTQVSTLLRKLSTESLDAAALALMNEALRWE